VISFLRSNLVWILLSVLISLGLWVIVTFQQDPEVTDVLANVAVDVQNVPKTVLVQPDTTSVQLTVTAPKDVWPQLKADRFHAVVDAGKVSPGVQQLPVNVVSIDSRARIESWSPDTIALRVDPLRTKTVPVQVILQGTVPFGYDSSAATVTPTEVTVSGPQSSVDQVATAVIQVSLDGVIKPVDQTMKPLPEATSGATVDKVTVVPEAVVVSVPVVQKLLYKTLTVQPAEQGNVALGYAVVGITVDPTTVTLVGDPKTLNDLQFVSTRPVDVTNATGDREVTGELALPGTVALARSQTILVRVLVAAAQGTNTILVSPRIVNPGTGIAYTLSPSAINVTVSGPIPVLSRLTPDDITAVVDAHNATTGAQTVPVVVTVSPLVKQVSIQPTNLVITVK
jgi:YbbR domain-containing protein